MINPAVMVAMFWTTKAKASPTSPLTVAASVDNLAPIAPLKYRKELSLLRVNDEIKMLMQRFRSSELTLCLQDHQNS